MTYASMLRNEKKNVKDREWDFWKEICKKFLNLQNLIKSANLEHKTMFCILSFSVIFFFKTNIENTPL